MGDYWPIFLSTFLGMLVGFVIRPICEGYAKRTGELIAERVYSAELEHEKARGRQPVDRENEEHKSALAQHAQLRLVALERRLTVHQEAFSIWWRLYHGMHTPAAPALVGECQDWWSKNCLFLEPSVRDAFTVAVASASGHDGLLRSYLPERDPLVRWEIDENWERIRILGTRIQEAVALPPIYVRSDAEPTAMSAGVTKS